MSLPTNFHAPSLTLSFRIQIGQKSGLLLLFIIYYLFECEYKAIQASLWLEPRLGLAITVRLVIVNSLTVVQIKRTVL